MPILSLEIDGVYFRYQLGNLSRTGQSAYTKSSPANLQPSRRIFRLSPAWWPAQRGSRNVQKLGTPGKYLVHHPRIRSLQAHCPLFDLMRRWL